MSRRPIPLPIELLKEVADAYESAFHLADDPYTKECYEALAAETIAHFAEIRITVEAWRFDGSPYQNSAEMIADTKNGHLYYLPTTDAYGPHTVVLDSMNPMLRRSSFVDAQSATPLLVNDLFRVVHDLHGHAEHGFSFGPLGEFNAYIVQASRYSEKARRALFTETLGQNSWVNFGKHMRRIDGRIPEIGQLGYVPPQQRPFAEQKIVLLPAELMEAVHAYCGVVLAGRLH